MKLTAVYRKVLEGYVAFVEELPGANTQGASLKEARENLLEAVELVLRANRELSEQDLGSAEVIREPFDPPHVKRRELIRHLKAQGCRSWPLNSARI